MDSGELRESLETLLDITELLLAGGNITSEELRSLEEGIKEIRGKLRPGVPEPEEIFPAGHWVFKVKRSQYTRFSVQAADEDTAWNKAVGRLHADVAAFRFTWDSSNPYDLSPLELERSPNG